jgi:uncharacterized protein (UPF0218 family)
MTHPMQPTLDAADDEARRRRFHDAEAVYARSQHSVAQAAGWARYEALQAIPQRPTRDELLPAGFEVDDRRAAL